MKTPKRVIDLLKSEIPAKISRNMFCIKTGINQNSIDKYLAGITEPTQSSLEKLSRYFDKPVSWLRGEEIRDSLLDTTFDEDQVQNEVCPPTNKYFIKPNPASVLALRASQIVGANFTELERMIKDMDIGRQVRTHFANSSTQLLLRSDINQELLN